MYVKRKLGEGLNSFSNLRFPFSRSIRSAHRYDVVVGIGGNLGDLKRRFEHLFFFFQRDKRIELYKTSLILQNPPFGYKEQDDFLNSIMFFKTSMQPRAFLRYLLKVEKHFGRKRSFPNAPRTLDLDIIFFNDRKIDTQELKVPHPHWHERESVVIPLLGALK
ncbi:MAG: 2-amino-4-hydroxy-6-hydroxymethyldihydropteridine diphosphokinase [Campylobacterales bacterium]|nr:2-amino-4-hydroxy-6-hydroxymethyldihydropteridine diphosphokinase [Campylobacterales bacterium]